MKLTKDYLRGSLALNRPILVLSVATTVASFVLFVLQQSNETITEMLQLSPSTPWGVFTSIFLHRGWDHLTSNLAMLWVWTLYILLLDSLLPNEYRKKRVLFFIPAVVGSAVVSKIIWALAFNTVNPNADFTSVGASGLVYAFCGAVLGIAAMNLVDALSKLKTESTHRGRVKSVILGNIVFVAMLLFIVTFSPDVFLSKAPGVNVFVHGIAFMMGMGAIMVREYVLPPKKSANVPPTQ